VQQGRWMRGARQHTLSLVFGGLFLAALVGQGLAGWAAFNSDQVAAGRGQLSLGRYLTSASFAVDVAENWQSEYLQFTLYILGTVWLVQRGSPESKKPSKAGWESDRDQKAGRFATADSPRWAKVGGFRTGLSSWSLSLAMGGIFLASWTVQSVVGWASSNEERLERLQDPQSWASTSSGRTSGPGRCRTGSRSSSPSGRWRC
jgi:hypothetical protein